MKFPFIKKTKKKEAPVRNKIQSRLSNVKKAANDPYSEREVTSLLKGLAEGDG